MLVVGVLLFAAAVVSAVILIVQNRGSVVPVHALGHTWTGHLYWLLLMGLIIALVGVLGLALLRGGAARARRLRRRPAVLATANEPPSERVGDPATSAFFADTRQTEADSATGGHRPMRRHASRRGHHAA